jgi:uncharacterized SAM-binding protein YcdF (DUF218 family)
MFFLFKKCFGILLAPGTIILILLSFGLLQLIFSGKSKRSGLIWLFLGTICFYLFSTAPLPGALLYHLEKQYEPLVHIQDHKQIKYIVILSSDARENPHIPPTSWLDGPSAFRVIDGIRLFHLFQDQPALIMTGEGCGAQMVAFAHSLGVPADKLFAENEALDTHGNAREVKSFVQDKPFLLVTSATHMPRSMKIFQLLGMKPIPAPADFRWPAKNTIYNFFPAGSYLSDMATAFHEYFGLAYLNFFPGRAGK